MIQGLQFQRFMALLLIIICGLTLRRFGYAVDLPFSIVKYGGSLLWGSMVYFLVAFAVATLASVRPAAIAVMALLVATGVELFRLYHTPWLDGFRLTMTGALLLGRVFSPWNIAAYAIGIAAACMLDPIRKSSRSR